LQSALPGRVEKKGIKLTPSQLTLNPDLAFDEGGAVADVKYKLTQPDWRRSDLYQVVAFATGYESKSAALVGFGDVRSAVPPSINVGSVEVQYLTWPIHRASPEEASKELQAAVAEWLEAASPIESQPRALSG
jgi:hypothetical protein